MAYTVRRRRIDPVHTGIQGRANDGDQVRIVLIAPAKLPRIADGLGTEPDYGNLQAGPAQSLSSGIYQITLAITESLFQHP